MSGAAGPHGGWGAVGMSGHCVTGKSNRWAGTEDGESTQMGSGQGDRGGLTWKHPGFHSWGGGAGRSGHTFSSCTTGSGGQLDLQGPLQSSRSTSPMPRSTSCVLRHCPGG